MGLRAHFSFFTAGMAGRFGRHEGPVALPLGALLDPFSDGGDLRFGERGAGLRAAACGCAGAALMRANRRLFAGSPGATMR